MPTAMDLNGARVLSPRCTQIVAADLYYIVGCMSQASVLASPTQYTDIYSTKTERFATMIEAHCRFNRVEGR